MLQSRIMLAHLGAPDELFIIRRDLVIRGNLEAYRPNGFCPPAFAFISMGIESDGLQRCQKCRAESAITVEDCAFDERMVNWQRDAVGQLVGVQNRPSA